MIKRLFEGLQIGKTISYLLIIMVLITIVYSNHFNNSFHFDDSHTIQNNIYIQDVKNIPLFFKDGTTFSSLPQNQSYRPVVSTSLAIDYWLGNGFSLFYFHLSSFILFLVQGVLMFFFLFKLFDSSFNNSWNYYIAMIAVALYLLHPANAETINYIIARSDLQSTFFVLLGFVLYIYSPVCKKYFLYLIPVGIGALAKPPAVMFAPLLFFYIILFEKQLSLNEIFNKQNVKQLIETIKNVIPAFVFCAFMYLLIDHYTPKTWQSGGASRFTFIITQPFVILHYFTTFFFPFTLSADTDWQPLTTMYDSRFVIGCAFIALMLFIAVWFSKDKRLRPISYGILWFFLALIPSSSIIPFAEVLNDHRVFFPYVGLVISVCYTTGLLLLKNKKHYQNKFINYEILVVCIVLVLLSGYAYGTHERNKVWNTEETLWKDVTIKSPKNARGLMNYGLSRMAKGDYPEAEKYFTQALNLWSGYSFLYINMGVLKGATGDNISAENYFKSGVQFGASYPDSWYFYGKFLCDQARFEEAVPMLTKALSLSPAHIAAHNQLMIAYYNLKQWDNLKALANATLVINPTNADALKYIDICNNNKQIAEPTKQVIKSMVSADDYLNLSLTYYNKSEWKKCIEACDSALKLNPNYADAFSNIGAAYNQLKQWDKAIDACNKALKINPQHKLANGNLNWAKTEKAKQVNQ